MKEKQLFYFIWILSGLLLVWHVLFLPVWEGFDEAPHFCYVQHLVEQKRVPHLPGRGMDDYCSREVEYTLERLPLNSNLVHGGTLVQQEYLLYSRYWAANPNNQIAEIPNSETVRTTHSSRLEIWEGQQPPLPYAVFTLPYTVLQEKSFYIRFFALRLTAVFIVWLGSGLLWKALRETVSAPSARLIGFATIVLHPMFFIHFARISNEALTFFLFSLSWYLLACLIKNPQRDWKWWMAFGLAYGLGTISKVFFIAGLPVLGLVLAYDAWGVWKTPEWRTRMGRYFLVAVSIAIPAVPWYLYQRFGFVMPGAGFTTQLDLTPAVLVHQILWTPWLAFIVEIAKNFMGFFGWSFLRAAQSYYLVHTLFLGFITIGFFHFLSTTKDRRIPLAAVGFPLCMLFGMAYYNLHYEVTSLVMNGGWYFFTIGAVMASLIGMAIQHSLPKKYHLGLLYGIILFHTLSIALLTVTTFISAYYAV